MWSLTFACPPNVADLNLAYVHPTPWSFWSSITLASIVHLSFLLIASPPTSSQPANRCVLLSIAGGLIAPIPTSMSGWWVSEWATLLLHLPHLRRSGGRDTDPAVAGKAAFVFFSSGWLVRNLRAQGAKIWLQQRRSTCQWPGVLPRREGAQVRATLSTGVFIFNPYMHLGCLAASDHAVRLS